MSLGKRHIGRRVAGVGVGVALMVLGLAAPASAAPVIASFTPDSGPNDCVVVITGTGFTNPSVTDVDFNGVNAIDFVVVSDTEIRAVSPGQTGFIVVTKGATAESSSSTTQFTDTTGAGTCGATVASFTPTCGVVGTTVTITGTNLLRDAGGAGTLQGSLVEFSAFNAAGNGVDAVHTGTTESPTSNSVLVPAGAADGVIAVTNAAGQTFSTVSFDVVTDPATCVAPTPTAHARSISFKITKSGNASGVVKSTEDPAFTDCVAAVPVKIQRKQSGAWKTVGKTTTNDAGAYTKKVKNPKGTQKFRALAPKVSLGDPVTDVCSKARSAVRKK